MIVGLKIILIFLAGLASFLVGISLLSKTIKLSFAERAAEILNRYTKNVFYSILVGIVLTIILDSSSAVIILTIVFINAGSLSFKKAIGIILGSNIGTTFSSQLIALDIYKYSFIAIIIGLLITLLGRTSTLKTTGKIILYLGVMFFGLFLMEQSTIPLKDSALFIEWINSIENNHNLGAIIGGLITLIIHSSGATVALSIIMTKQNIISGAVGISIMLGAELGTCFDTAIATIRGTRESFKAAIFHASFNLLTIIIALTFFDSFVSMVYTITEQLHIGTIIANAHFIFNVAGVILILPFIGVIERMLHKLLPNKTIK